jgi:hypothetical protein
MFMLKEELSLNHEDEMSAVDEGVELMNKLIRELADAPTPTDPTPRQLLGHPATTNSTEMSYVRKSQACLRMRMKRALNFLGTMCAVFAVFFMPVAVTAQVTQVAGRVKDLQGRLLPHSRIQIRVQGEIKSDIMSGPDGRFEAALPLAHAFIITVYASGFQPVVREFNVDSDKPTFVEISMTRLASHSETVTVTADVSDLSVMGADPAQRVLVRQDLLEANPGRPGAPVSIPGYPIETASSGIKAPQYFAPGVAGDHGEPIAQYISLGGYLVPNNLSANAHGNGYADPNIFIPEVLESVQIDGGAYNVREGNHSVNLSAIYGLRSSLDPFVTVTGDYRDIDLAGGFSPDSYSWISVSASYGNGFLQRLEHRQQYKVNGYRTFDFGRHHITLLGIGYYGSSFVPGLVPIFSANAQDPAFPNGGDTIDPRQKDQTHTGILGASDAWQLSGSQQLQMSGFFRSYNLSLFSDFGQGLIRQSEYRTVAGGNATYVNKVAAGFSLLAGLDYEREAPRRDDLDHYGFFTPRVPSFYGPFTRVDGANVTIESESPYVAGEGTLARFFHYYVGWRHDEINLANQDLLRPANSFQNWTGLDSPKATLGFSPKDSWAVPSIALSFGKSFFTNDPRIGLGTRAGAEISSARSYQLVARKTFHHTDVHLTLGHVTTSATLAKIDPDTGLQQDEGPGRLRYASVSLRQTFNHAFILATFSRADARDLSTGQPTPEAPRTIIDLLGTIQNLPFRVKARGEFEYIGAKPLGTGCAPVDACVGVPVKEFRAAVVRSFLDDRLDLGVNMLIASGFTGQTTENFFGSNVQEVVGVRIPSYASIAVTYRFGRTKSH